MGILNGFYSIFVEPLVRNLWFNWYPGKNIVKGFRTASAKAVENNKILEQRLKNQSIQNNQIIDEDEAYRLSDPYSSQMLPSDLGRLMLPEGIDPDEAIRALTRFQEGKMIWNPTLRKYLKAYEGGDSARLEEFGPTTSSPGGSNISWKDAYDSSQGLNKTRYGSGGDVIKSEEDKDTDLSAEMPKEEDISLLGQIFGGVGEDGKGLGAAFRDYFREGGGVDPYMFSFFGDSGYRERKDEE